MTAGLIGGKRELLARGLLWSGITLVINHLPQRDQLVVLNYHRIGNADDDLFDPDLISASASELDDQVSYVKRHASLVTLEEALAFVEGAGSAKAPRCRVLITFDDGYLDNYEVAFPILRSHGAQGVFFLTPSMVGSGCIPWWDRVAYFLKTARKRHFTLSDPVQLEVDLDKNDFLQSLRQVSTACYRLGSADAAKFMQELAEQAGAEQPAELERRYLNWDEARRMLDGGMAIGSHTNSHEMLGRLALEQQARELASSRETLKERLGVNVDTLAYPYGTVGSFSEQTQKLTRDAGYRAAFSLRRDTNVRREMNPYSLNRICIGGQSWPRFRVQASIGRLVGKFWP
jgi:peptidoglycan/xylan/chitin deacetylase (PgdA/CDA1 family)